MNVCDGVPIRVVDTETFLRMSENLLVEKETFRNHRTYEGSTESDSSSGNHEHVQTLNIT